MTLFWWLQTLSPAEPKYAKCEWQVFGNQNYFENGNKKCEVQMCDPTISFQISEDVNMEKYIIEMPANFFSMTLNCRGTSFQTFVSILGCRTEDKENRAHKGEETDTKRRMKTQFVPFNNFFSLSMHVPSMKSGISDAKKIIIYCQTFNFFPYCSGSIHPSFGCSTYDWVWNCTIKILFTTIPPHRSAALREEKAIGRAMASERADHLNHKCNSFLWFDTVPSFDDGYMHMVITSTSATTRFAYNIF